MQKMIYTIAAFSILGVMAIVFMLLWALTEMEIIKMSVIVFAISWVYGIYIYSKLERAFK